MLLVQNFAIEANENEEELFPVIDQIVAFFSRKKQKTESKTKTEQKSAKVKASETNTKQTEVSKTTKVSINQQF